MHNILLCLPKISADPYMTKHLFFIFYWLYLGQKDYGAPPSYYLPPLPVS